MLWMKIDWKEIMNDDGKIEFLESLLIFTLQLLIT